MDKIQKNKFKLNYFGPYKPNCVDSKIRLPGLIHLFPQTSIFVES